MLSINDTDDGGETIVRSGHYAGVLSTSAASMSMALVEPLIALLPPSSNSIQPSLNTVYTVGNDNRVDNEPM